jgi:RNA polymerase sigma-70 factor (ECF subfamily)
VYEAFDASYLFLTELAKVVGLTLGVIAFVSPFFSALASAFGRTSLWAARLAAMSDNTPARDPVELLPGQFEPSLGLEGLALAQDTRGLIESLAHARKRRRHWQESSAPVEVKRGWWRVWIDAGRDAEFGPTIGATREVWTWLSSAEAYADHDTFAAREVAEVAGLVRARLLGEGELRGRLDDILSALLRLDGEFYVYERSPYRGGLAGQASRPRPPVLSDDEEERDGPDARWEKIQREHGGLLKSVAARYVRDPDRRKDLEQEISLAVWKAMPGFRGEASLKTYAMRIAHYCAARFRRREPVFVGGSEPFEATFFGTERNAEDELTHDRRRRALHKAIESLPEAQREALLLQLQGVPYREIAKRLRISESNASVRITRARKALHRKLALA